MTNRVMKDSGVEWIGQIPKHWSETKLKRVVFDIDSGGTPTSSNAKFYNDNGTPFVNISDMTKGEYIHDTQKHLTENGILNKRLNIHPEGTILYSMYASLGKVAELKTNAAISQAILAFKADSEIIKKEFLKFILKMYEVHISMYSNGTTQSNLNREIIENFKIILPELEEQQKIAAFLDEKVSHVDSIIEDTNKSIENLKAYKQSLITETVTKGLDPNVEMKDSGIDRIGGIPLHWKLKKLKYILSNEKNSIRVGPFGSHLKNNDFVEEGKWVYNQRIVLDNNYNSNDTFITEEKYKEMHAFKVEYKDILLTTRGTIGKISRVPKQFKEGIIHSSVIKFRLDESKFTYRLLEYLFNESSFIKEQILQLSNATTIEVIYSNTLKNVLIPVPSLEEQDRIICFLDEKITKLNTILEEKEFLISELESYKKSLIYEYVTGKKEVK